MHFKQVNIATQTEKERHEKLSLTAIGLLLAIAAHSGFAADAKKKVEAKK